MTQETDLQSRIAETIQLLRRKLGVRDATLTASVRRARRRLPRRIYRQALILARAEQMADHPRLRMVLDTPALEKASDEVLSHLNSINLADRRWAMFLSVLGSLALGLLFLSVLVLVVLRWRGFV